MQRQLRPCAALAFTLIAACTEEDDQLPDTPIINAVYDMSADFSSYKTFDVIEPSEVPADEPAPQAYLESNREAVVQAIVTEMEARGYVRAGADADLVITPLVRLQDVEVAVQEAWYDYYYGWYWGYGYPWYDEDIVTLEAGTLIIDAVDVGERENVEDDKLVFRGYATAVLPDQPTDVSHEISAAVADIFDHWPTE